MGVLYGKQLKWETIFETPARFNFLAAGDGIGTAETKFGTPYKGFSIQRGTTPTGKAWCYDATGYNNLDVFNRNPEFYAVCEAQISAANSWDAYIVSGWLGTSGVDYGNNTHFGFRIKNNNGVQEIYATNSAGDGSDTFTQTLLTMPAGSLADVTTLYAKVFSGERIDFYINGALVATHTTCLPTAAQTASPFGAAIMGSAGTANDVINVHQAGFWFDL